MAGTMNSDEKIPLFRELIRIESGVVKPTGDFYLMRRIPGFSNAGANPAATMRKLHTPP